MRIAHVFKDANPPVAAGITRYMADLAAASVARGAEVDIYVAGVKHTRSEQRPDGVTIHRFAEAGRALSMPLSWSLARAARRLEADVVHVHSPNPIAELGLLANRNDPAVVVSFHAQLGRQRFLDPVYGPVQARLMRRARAVLAASQMLVDAPELSAASGRVRLAPYGVSPQMLEDQPGVPRRLDGSLRLLFVGRLVYYKGIEVLLDAVGEVEDVVLTVFGDGPLREQVARRIHSDPSLSGRVTLVCDGDDSTVKSAHKQHDVVVLPSVSRAEAFGLSMAEAMANGLPAISTRLGTGTDWVNLDGQTGLVVAPGDSSALAGAIECLKDDTLRHRLAAGALRRAREEFSFDRHVDLIHDVYEQAVAS